MSIYVDDLLRKATVRHGSHLVRGCWSHLLADDSAELLAFAARLGLHRSWIQQARTPLEHFDITAGKRQHAITAGALEIDVSEDGHLTRAKRSGIPFDLEQVRADPAAFEADLHAAIQHLHQAPAASGPRRVQLSRRTGSTIFPSTISVATPTRWASPYRPASRTPQAYEVAVEHFRGYLTRNPALVELARAELVGVNLACWCPLFLPCHADVWLSIANPVSTDSSLVQGTDHVRAPERAR